MTPQVMTCGFSTINKLNKGASIWSLNTRVTMPLNITNCSKTDHAVGQSASIGDSVGAKLDYIEENYRTGFVIWSGNRKLQFDLKNIEKSQPPLQSTPVGVRMSDPKAQATDSSA